MGTSLTGLTPATTYDALIKVGDNGPLSATAKVLSDGLGNDSPLAMSTTLVGIGTTTPTSKLTSVNTITTSYGATGNAALSLSGAGSANEANLINFGYDGGTQQPAYIGYLCTSGAGSTNGDLLLATRTATTDTAPTERMRITSAGNVGIGTTTPASLLSIAGSSATLVKGIILRNGNGTDGSSVSLDFETSAGTIGDEGSLAGRILGVRTAGGTTGALTFSTTNAGTLSEKVRILPTGGITFNGDTAAANALDDYEEGTWTPVLRGSGTPGTYETASVFANYTKIGRQVSVNMIFNLAAAVTGGGTGYAQITGLPFSKSANQQIAATAKFGTVDFNASTKYVIAEFNSSAATSIFYFAEVLDNATPIDMPIASFGNNSQIQVSLTYFV